MNSKSFSTVRLATAIDAHGVERLKVSWKAYNVKADYKFHISNSVTCQRKIFSVLNVTLVNW